MDLGTTHIPANGAVNSGGDSSDVSNVGRRFVRWALGRWPLLRAFFLDSRYGPGGVPAWTFIRWLQTLQFGGDAVGLVAELQRGALAQRGFSADDVLIFPQLQCLKQRHEAAAGDALVQALKERRGTVLRAWRLDLDLRG